MTAAAVVRTEIELAREQPVIVPAERQVVSVQGRDAESYLQGQCSQDVAALAPGSAADALLLTPQGKLQALVRVVRRAPDAFLVDVDDGHVDTVVRRLQQFRLRVDVEIEILPWRCLAIRRFGAPELAPELTPGAEHAIGFRWGAVHGLDLLGPDPQPPAGVAAISDWAWQVLRIEAGIPVMGAELDERTIAAEAGLVERAVSVTKGCYTGQELVARLDARGNRVARYLRGVVVPGPSPEDGGDSPVGADITGERSPGSDDGSDTGAGAEAGAGAQLTEERDAGSRIGGGRSLGTVTSAAWSPIRRSWVGLAYVHRSVQPPAPVRVVGGEPLHERAGEVRLIPLD